MWSGVCSGRVRGFISMVARMLRLVQIKLMWASLEEYFGEWDLCEENDCKCLKRFRLGCIIMI